MPHHVIPPADVINRVIRESGMEANLQGDEEQRQALRNVEELVSSATEFQDKHPGASLADYLYEVSLVSDVDAIDPEAGAVTLMTLHAAKGLEFPAVIMVGCEEGLLPFDRGNGEQRDIEEERRLAFVGMTRAMDHLYMTHAKYRMIRGQTMRQGESHFLLEIGDEGVDRQDKSYVEPPPRRDAVSVEAFNRRQREGDDFYEDTDMRQEIEALEQADLVPPQFAQFRPGRRVRHPRFGPGRIVRLSHDGVHTRAVVDFDTSGRRTLVLQMAGLELE